MEMEINYLRSMEHFHKQRTINITIVLIYLAILCNVLNHHKRI